MAQQQPFALASRVIIGGGTGFIGRHLASALLDHGYKITVISRNPAPDALTWSQVQQMRGFPMSANAIVNLAGENIMRVTKRWSPKFKKAVYESRVNTTQILADAINNSHVPPSVFVLVTGIGAYEPSDVNIYDEGCQPTGSDFFSNLVLETEKAAQLNPYVRFVTIRTGAVLGKKGGVLKSLPFSWGGHIASGQQYMPWIHIEDLTRLILFAILNYSVQGVLNGVAPHIVTNEEFFNALRKTKKRRKMFSLPNYFVRMLYGSERAAALTMASASCPNECLHMVSITTTLNWRMPSKTSLFSRLFGEFS